MYNMFRHYPICVDKSRKRQYIWVIKFNVLVDIRHIYYTIDYSVGNMQILILSFRIFKNI
jgi:hypothetical protein